MSLPSWKAQLQALASESDHHRRASLCHRILASVTSPLAQTALDAYLKQALPDWDRGLLWAGAAAEALWQGQFQAALAAEKKAQKTKYPQAVQAWLALARWENSRQHTPPTWLQSQAATKMPELWLQDWVTALLKAGHATAAESLLEKNLASQTQRAAPGLLTVQLWGSLCEERGAYLKALELYSPLSHQPEIALRQAEVLKNLGQTTEAGHILKVYLAQAQAQTEAQTQAPCQDPANALLEARLHSQYLLCLTSLADQTNLEAEKACWAARHRPTDAPLPALPRPLAPTQAKLRLGYLAPDFGSHSIYHVIRCLFAGHNRKEFELYAYAGQTRANHATALLQASEVHWRDLEGHSPRQIAEAIQADQLDILIDASGHTALHLLPVFYYRPAPLQISGLCFNSNTGLPECDFQLTDPICSQVQASTNENLPAHERPLPLASWLFWFPPTEAVPLSAPQGSPQLGCAHHPGRLSLEICQLWAQILNSHPHTQLRLKHRCFGSPDTQAVFRARFAQWGISADRLHFEGASHYLDYLAFYNQLSLALDPFPYHGGLTSAEALWMGVPLLNLQGPMLGGLSLLSQVGHPEWSTLSASDFLAQATSLLAKPWDLEARNNLRQACENAPFTQAAQLISGLEQNLKRLSARNKPEC